MSASTVAAARVAVSLGVRKELTYSVPESLALHVGSGRRVVVTVKGRPVKGVVTEMLAMSEEGLKPILDIGDIDPDLGPDIMRLCKWISEYYMAPLGEVLRLASASPSGGGLRFRWNPGSTIPPSGTAARICDLLGRRPRAAASLVRELGHAGTLATLSDLIRSGDVLASAPRSTRRERSGGVTPSASRPPLTAEQRSAAAAIISAIGSFKPVLLHGVTASGKTLVYLTAVEEVVRRGQRALLLVPEIAMVIMLEESLAGLIPFCAIHSQVTPAVRARRIAEIRSGAYPFVIGTRSALFAPIPDLGLIVVDEEHDASYKQDERVRYNARDAAVMHAKFLGIPIVLGSATPSIETYNLASESRYELVEMPTRLSERGLPAPRIIDMRGKKRSEIISDELAAATLGRLQRGEQVILLHNRRGYALHLICNGCGAVFRCRNCQVSLVYHKELDRYCCHHCGAREAQPASCAACGDSRFVLMGEGTEKVLEKLQSMFAGYRIERIDSDVATSEGRVRKLLAEFAAGEIHLLVGTQILAKGHHFPNVTLVGVISLDHLLGMPDFRAAERVFQLVAQVAGRSGRGDLQGEVILQTRHPAHYAITAGCAQEYAHFFAKELEYRRTLRYPPFASIVLITCQGRDKLKTSRNGRALAGLLEKFRAPDVEMAGPVFAPIPRLRELWRVNLMLRGPKKPLREMLGRFRSYSDKNKLRYGQFVIDVDPQSLM